MFKYKLSLTIFCSTAVLLALFCSSIQAGYGFRFSLGHHQADNPQKKTKKSGPTPDDPLVNEDTPPPDETPLITKVSWCEMQVFGHTFSDAGLQAPWLNVNHMPLPKRLDQLNKKLHFKPEKSGLQLMDEDSVDALVKYVYAKKNASSTNGSSPQVPADAAK